jgi:hypothetical protein
MANTTFSGPVRSENGFQTITKNSTTGAVSTTATFDTATSVTTLTATGAITGASLAVTGDVSTSGGGIGYATGSGGTVTQLTNRTTGVTLNKRSGAITLVSAAGSTSPATFTVTNSTVAATDVVILNQKSGTDLYHLLVTAVAAGSFNITAFTTGGTTTEAPVINFAVIDAVTA